MGAAGGGGGGPANLHQVHDSNLGVGCRRRRHIRRDLQLHRLPRGVRGRLYLLQPLLCSTRQGGPPLRHRVRCCPTFHRSLHSIGVARALLLSCAGSQADTATAGTSRTNSVAAFASRFKRSAMTQWLRMEWRRHLQRYL